MVLTHINEIKSMSTSQIKIRLQAMELYDNGMSRKEMLQLLLQIIISSKCDRFDNNNNSIENLNVQQLIENDISGRHADSQLSVNCSAYKTKITVIADVHHSLNYDPLTNKEM